MRSGSGIEKAGIELRELVGVDNIMWESDYPHIASTYPRSWSYVEDSLVGVPQHERRKMLLWQRAETVRGYVSMANNSLISVDNHVQEYPQVWTKRLSRSKWGVYLEMSTFLATVTADTVG